MNDSEEYFDYSAILRSVKRRWFYLPLGLAMGAVLSVSLTYFSASQTVAFHLSIGKWYTGDIKKGLEQVEGSRFVKELIKSSIHPQMYARHYGLSSKDVSFIDFRKNVSVTVLRKTPGVLKIVIREKTYDDALQIARGVSERVVARHKKLFGPAVQIVQKEMEVIKERMHNIEMNLQEMNRYMNKQNSPESQMKAGDVFMLELMYDKKQTLNQLRDEYWRDEKFILFSRPTRMIEERPKRMPAPYPQRAIFGAVTGLGLSLLAVLWMGRTD